MVKGSASVSSSSTFSRKTLRSQNRQPYAGGHTKDLEGRSDIWNLECILIKNHVMT